MLRASGASSNHQHSRRAARPMVAGSSAGVHPRLDRGWTAMSGKSRVRQDDLPVLDLDQIDAGVALPALLTGRADLVELDHPVHAGQLDLPERLADRVGLGLAGLGDGGRDGADAIIAAEALGQPGEWIIALLPLVDERL